MAMARMRNPLPVDCRTRPNGSTDNASGRSLSIAVTRRVQSETLVARHFPVMIGSFAFACTVPVPRSGDAHRTVFANTHVSSTTNRQTFAELRDDLIRIVKKNGRTVNVERISLHRDSGCGVRTLASIVALKQRCLIAQPDDPKLGRQGDSVQSGVNRASHPHRAIHGRVARS